MAIGSNSRDAFARATTASPLFSTLDLQRERSISMDSIPCWHFQAFICTTDASAGCEPHYLSQANLGSAYSSEDLNFYMAIIKRSAPTSRYIAAIQILAPFEVSNM